MRSGAVALRVQTYVRSVVALTVMVDVYLQRVAEQRQSSRSRDLGHELRRPQPLVVVEVESQSQHEQQQTGHGPLHHCLLYQPFYKHPVTTFVVVSGETTNTDTFPVFVGWSFLRITQVMTTTTNVSRTVFCPRLQEKASKAYNDNYQEVTGVKHAKVIPIYREIQIQGSQIHRFVDDCKWWGGGGVTPLHYRNKVGTKISVFKFHTLL